MIRVGVTQRVEVVEEYEERRDCLDQRWGQLFRALGYLPIPLFNAVNDVATYVHELNLDAVVLTGGNDLREVDDGTNIAPERDEFETALVQTAISEGLPILGVCRGAQLLNIHFGGAVSTVEGHVGTSHQLSLVDPPLAYLPEEIRVNSYHNYGILANDLATNLEVTARTADGSIEWFTHESLAITAIMWHPERTPELTAFNRRIIHDSLKREDV
jgi:putative glutamine amidotransferase